MAVPGARIRSSVDPARLRHSDHIGRPALRRFRRAVRRLDRRALVLLRPGEPPTESVLPGNFMTGRPPGWTSLAWALPGPQRTRCQTGAHQNTQHADKTAQGLI